MNEQGIEESAETRNDEDHAPRDHARQDYQDLSTSSLAGPGYEPGLDSEERVDRSFEERVDRSFEQQVERRPEPRVDTGIQDKSAPSGDFPDGASTSTATRPSRPSVPEAEEAEETRVPVEAAQSEPAVSNESEPKSNAPVDRVELESLRKMLREQREATLRAVKTAADLQTQLSSAKLEVDKVGKQYHGFAKQANTRKQAEIANLHSQWNLAQRELARQKQEKKAEVLRAALAAEKLSTLQKELTVAAHLAQNADGILSRQRKIGRTIAIVAGAVAAIILGIVYWPSLTLPGAGSADTPKAAAVKAAAIEDAREVNPAPPSTMHVEDNASGLLGGLTEPSAAFTTSLNRLDDALAAVPGRSPEEIFQEISKKGHGCMFEWNNGRPSLLFGGTQGPAGSISSVIDQCANAVKRLR